MIDAILRYLDLPERHSGVTKAIACGYAEAAGVCLDRHHVPPQDFLVSDDQSEQLARVEWSAPDLRTRRAWGNDIDATEAGAYGIALASVELARGLVAVARAEHLTGAVFCLGSPGADEAEFEKIVRLEVSGVDGGGEGEVRTRLREKIRQAGRGRSNLPAIASAVGFKALRVLLADVEQK
jgi:hypothetical protein